MGLGIAIAGGIICATMLAVFSIVFSTSEQIYEINSSRMHAADLQSVTFQTNMTVSDVTAESGNRFVNFTLTNTGNEKLWNYEKFDVIINYTANVGGTPTQKTERFTYFMEGTSGVENISLDQVSSVEDVCSTCTLSHTVSGTNKILVLGLSTEGDTPSSVTYDNEDLTQIRFDEVAFVKRTELWYLIDPPSGSADIVVTQSNGKVIMGAISLNGVHQLDPVGANNGSNNSAFGTHPSTSLTTTVNNSWIVDVVSTTNGPMTPDASQLERWDLIRNPLRGSGSTEQTTTAGLYIMSWTNDGSTPAWSISAAAIRPASTDLICGPDGSFDANNWTVKSISNDYTDPDLINTNESALICTKLAYPVYSNGDVKVTVSTDSGHTKSSSTTAT
jgi:archaellum component FlaF (FlaF/FlaG flagellin family)